MPEMETLHCPAEGGHTYTRPKVRGRKPKYCPKHLYLKFEKKDPEGIVTTYTQRLIRPAFERDLPEGYTPVADPLENLVAVEVPTPEDPLKKARRVKAENAVKKKRSLNQQAQAAIDNPLCEPELRRKLQYCLDHDLTATRDFYLTEAVRRGYVEARA